MSRQQKSDLPLSDYDHLTLGALETRIHALQVHDLDRLLDFEHAHGARLPVLTLLEKRRDAVAAGAPVSEGAPAADPATSNAPAAGSAVSPATSGPPVNPPSHGVPTNPAQPR